MRFIQDNSKIWSKLRSFLNDFGEIPNQLPSELSSTQRLYAIDELITQNLAISQSNYDLLSLLPAGSIPDEIVAELFYSDPLTSKIASDIPAYKIELLTKPIYSVGETPASVTDISTGLQSQDESVMDVYDSLMNAANDNLATRLLQKISLLSLGASATQSIDDEIPINLQNYDGPSNFSFLFSDLVSSLGPNNDTNPHYGLISSLLSKQASFENNIILLSSAIQKRATSEKVDVASITADSIINHSLTKNMALFNVYDFDDQTKLMDSIIRTTTTNDNNYIEPSLPGSIITPLTPLEVWKNYSGDIISDVVIKGYNAFSSGASLLSSLFITGYDKVMNMIKTHFASIRDSSTYKILFSLEGVDWYSLKATSIATDTMSNPRWSASLPLSGLPLITSSHSGDGGLDYSVLYSGLNISKEMLDEVIGIIIDKLNSIGLNFDKQFTINGPGYHILVSYDADTGFVNLAYHPVFVRDNLVLFTTNNALTKDAVMYAMNATFIEEEWKEDIKAPLLPGCSYDDAYYLIIKLSDVRSVVSDSVTTLVDAGIIYINQEFLNSYVLHYNILNSFSTPSGDSSFHMLQDEVISLPNDKYYHILKTGMKIVSRETLDPEESLLEGFDINAITENQFKAINRNPGSVYRPFHNVDLNILDDDNIQTFYQSRGLDLSQPIAISIEKAINFGSIPGDVDFTPHLPQFSFDNLGGASTSVEMIYYTITPLISSRPASLQADVITTKLTTSESSGLDVSYIGSSIIDEYAGASGVIPPQFSLGGKVETVVNETVNTDIKDIVSLSIQRDTYNMADYNTPDGGEAVYTDNVDLYFSNNSHLALLIILLASTAFRTSALGCITETVPHRGSPATNNEKVSSYYKVIVKPFVSTIIFFAAVVSISLFGMKVLSSVFKSIPGLTGSILQYRKSRNLRNLVSEQSESVNNVIIPALATTKDEIVNAVVANSGKKRTIVR